MDDEKDGKMSKVGLCGIDEEKALECLKNLDTFLGNVIEERGMSDDDGNLITSTLPGVLLMLENLKDDPSNFNLSIFDFTTMQNEPPSISTIIAYGLIALLDEDCDMVAEKGKQFIEHNFEHKKQSLKEADVVSLSEYKQLANKSDGALPVNESYTFPVKTKGKDEDDPA